MKTTKFKPSEIGPIPVDWEVKRLGEVGEPLMCKRVLKCQTMDSGDIPFYKIGTFGKIADTYISRPLFELFRKQYSYPKKGDILLSAAGTIGRTVVFDGEDAYFQDSNIVWVDNDESIVRNDYLHWYYKVINWQTEDGGIVSRLYNNNLRNSCIAIPPLPEQKAIAEALSDVDALLAAMTTLIEKKRAIKQGAMQELLGMRHDEFGMRNEPIRRLAGFSGAWVEKRLGECATMFSGGTPPSKVEKYYGGCVPWVSISDISIAGKYIDRTAETLTDAGLNNSSAKWYPPNTLLFAMYASIGKCCIAKGRMTSSQAILGIYDLKDIDLEFLYYLLTFRNREFLTMGQTGTQSNLSKAIIGEIVVYAPTLAEQQAIAAVLSDMDAEIAALEAKRAKYERIKQGMMQELLTGKTRLLPSACTQVGAGRCGPTWGTCGG